jgi:acetyl-CoA C-acetyltransferase
MASKLFYDPVRELTMAPISDGACALVLASEKRAREITDRPVWIQGVGFCHDAYLRDRDLSELGSLQIAAQKAYAMAGVKEPMAELDFAEVTERYAHEELMIYEALGLCDKGRGKGLVRSGVTEAGGEFPVNPSGGALGADPICATGLIRLVEAVKQIRGEADGYQVEGVGRAVAHGQFGICAQKNAVFVLGGESC